MKRKSKILQHLTIVLIIFTSFGILCSCSSQEQKVNKDVAISNTHSTQNNEKQPIHDTLQNLNNTVYISEVVIYNSHFDETYREQSICDISQVLKNKIIINGVKCIYLNNANIKTSSNKLPNSYKKSRNLILKEIQNPGKCILIDLHSGQIPENSDSNVAIYIGKSNKGYIENEKYAKAIAKELNNLDSEIKCQVLYKEAIYNQDLSGRAILIVINKNRNMDINKEITNFAIAIKNIKV